jgi:glyoxylase-like metal-dependent hydrolase (beta-lactamase superfamily II)
MEVTMLSRRKFLQSSAALAALPAVSWPTSLALAAGPAKHSNQVPGYFRISVGDIEVTALYDGMIILKPDILHGTNPKEMAVLLEDGCLYPTGSLPIPISAFLINTGQNLFMIDTGVGTGFGDKAGMIPGNIKAAGYSPEQVETILLTHMHSDHVLGLVDGNGQAIFPGAVVRVSQAEADYWLNQGLENRIPEGQKRFLAKIRQAVAPYMSSRKFKPFGPGESPAEGVSAVALPGHTPGQCGYKLSSQGQSLLAWGDIAHCQAAQFPRPEVTIDFDVDPAQAKATRKAIMAQAAREQCWIAGPHLPYPGLGHIRPRPKGYAWVPAEYRVAGV